MPSLGDAQKEQAEEAIKILKQRRQDLTKTIRATKTPSALSALTAQGKVTRQILGLNDAVTDLTKRYGTNKAVYVATKSFGHIKTTS